MVLLVVAHAELSGSHTMDLLVGMDDVATFSGVLHRAGEIFRCMADLKRHAGLIHFGGKEMEVVDCEVLFVGCLRVIAVADIENIFSHVFLDDEPRSATESESFALSDGVEPQSAVLADALSRLPFDDVAGLLAEITADIFCVVDITEEADPLRIFALRMDEMLPLSDLAHLVLNEVPDGENSFLQLPVVDLCQEVGLILYGVGTGGEPFPSVDPLGLRIVACGDEVIVVSHLLVEGTELDESVAHHVGVRGETSLNLFHCVACHLAPVFLMTVHYLQTAVKAGGHGSSHLQVFLGVAVPLFLFLGSDFDVETVGVQTHPGEFVDDDRTVYSPGEQHGDALITNIFYFQHDGVDGYFVSHSQRSTNLPFALRSSMS